MNRTTTKIISAFETASETAYISTKQLLNKTDIYVFAFCDHAGGPGKDFKTSLCFDALFH
jgi:hypothetical protein